MHKKTDCVQRWVGSRNSSRWEGGGSDVVVSSLDPEHLEQLDIASVPCQAECSPSFSEALKCGDTLSACISHPCLNVILYVQKSNTLIPSQGKQLRTLEEIYRTTILPSTPWTWHIRNKRYIKSLKSQALVDQETVYNDKDVVKCPY